MKSAPPMEHADEVRAALSLNVAVDIAGRFGYLVTRFLIPPFILAHVTLEAYGLWSAAFVLVSYLGISTMGISNVYIKYIAEFAARKEFDRASALLSTGLFITVPLCVLIFAVIGLSWNSLANNLHIALALRADGHEVVLSVVAIFLASMSLSAFRDTLIATQQTFWVQAIWILTYTTETILIYFLVSAGRGIRGLAEAYVVRTFLEIALCMLLVFRLFPWLRISSGRVSSPSFHLLFTFGGVTQVQSLLAVGLNSIERIVAAPLAGLAATGLLDVAKKIPSMAGSIPLAFASSLLPAASYLQGGASSEETIRKLYLKGARYMHLASGLMIALVAAMPGPIMRVWAGKTYAGASFLMAAFSIAAQVNLLTGAGSSILRGLGRIREEFFYLVPNVFFLALTLPLSWWIAGKWTALGIGLSAAISTCLAAAVFLCRINRLLEISWQTYFQGVVLPGVMPYLIAIPLAVVGYFVVPHLSRWQGAAALVGIGALYSTLSVLLIFRTVFANGERLWFEAMAQKTLDRLLPLRFRSLHA